MTVLAVVGGSILGYFLVGACWARSQAVRFQGEISANPNFNPTYDWTLRERLVHATLFWAIFAIGALLHGFVDWLAKPVSKRREEVAGLRARATQMAEMLDTLPGEEDRRILQAVIDENLALAKELAL